MNLVSVFKKILKEQGLNVKIRAQKAGCLDACEHGPSMVVYPEGVFYGGVTEKDVQEIIDEHLINDRPVKRLLIDL